MAIIDCNECGNEISSTAVKCPQCGKVQHPFRNALRWIFGAIGFILFINGLWKLGLFK